MFDGQAHALRAVATHLKPKGTGDVLFSAAALTVTHGRNASEAERHWRPPGDSRMRSSASCRNASEAERHWRRWEEVLGALFLVLGIKAHPAERHWRRDNSVCVAFHLFVASKPTQPKGIGDLSPFASRTKRHLWHQSPPSRRNSWQNKERLALPESGCRSLVSRFSVLPLSFRETKFFRRQQSFFWLSLSEYALRHRCLSLSLVAGATQCPCFRGGC